MKFYVNSLLLVISVLGTTSCSFKDAIKMQKQMTNTQVVSVNISNNNKEIHYIDMIHIGQQAFYDNVKKEILTYKQNGYVLFYEWIDYENADDISLRKTKKLVGFIPSTKGYEGYVSNIKINGVVVQNNDLFLGLENELDFNVDISPKKLISVYEERFGVIELSSEELETPIYSETKAKRIDKNLEEIILNYRNEYLAKQIHKSEYDKIIVIYGAAHQKGLVEELQKLDDNWNLLAN